MKVKVFAVSALVLVAGLLTTAATQNWVATVARADAGHVIGNPAAARTVTEYISYTCPHCATFVREGEDALKLGYIAPGKVKLQIRHLLRDPVDLTAALLAQCGAPAKFPQNHSALMLAQGTWLPKMTNATAGQKARWTSGDMAARRKAMASDMGFYAIMEKRGYSRNQSDACLADEVKARELAEASARDWKLPGIGGTPAFAIDNVVLSGTHSWRSLQVQLDVRM